MKQSGLLNGIRFQFTMQLMILSYKYRHVNMTWYFYIKHTKAQDT